LTGGTWIVATGATLDLHQINLTTNQATVTLNGTSARFPAINSLAVTSGSFSILGGANFTTAGALSNSGSLTIGPGSTLTVSGAYSQTSTASLTEQIGGPPTSGQFGQLAVTGAATLDGTLALSLANGFEPDLGASYLVLDYGSHTGTFATITGLNIGNGKVFTPSYNAMNLTLTVTAG
jgi:hypothetical protein